MDSAHLSPFPILLLPRELRDEILECAILSRTHPLPYDCERVERKDVYFSCWFGGRRVLYPRDSHEPVAGLTALLCANRQLYSEVQERMGALPSSLKHTYTLDIYIHEEKSLLPTWTSVPVLTDRVEEVIARIQIPPSPHTPGRFHHSGFRGGDGGPPLISWCFSSILERFLRAGPLYTGMPHDTTGTNPQTSKSNFKDRRISLKRLKIDVLTPQDSGPEPEQMSGRHGLSLAFLPPCHTPSKLDPAMKYLSSRYLAEFLSAMLSRLLGYRRSHGEVLYERLENILLRLDGRVYREWNIPVMLHSLGKDDWLTAHGKLGSLLGWWETCQETRNGGSKVHGLGI